MVCRPGRATSPQECLLGQVGADMNDVVGDRSESDPAPYAVGSFVGGSSQSVPAFEFENTDPAFTARAPFLKLLEPRLLLALLSGWALGVMARNRYLSDPQRLG